MAIYPVDLEPLQSERLLFERGTKLRAEVHANKGLKRSNKIEISGRPSLKCQSPPSLSV